MSWNYRILKSESGGETTLALHEVYYNKDGTMGSWTEKPVSLEGYESVEELVDEVGLMATAIASRPVLKMAEMPKRGRGGK